MTAPNAGPPRPGPRPASPGTVPGVARPGETRPAAAGLSDSPVESSDLVQRARNLRGRPLAEHADTYDEIHAELHRSLAGIDTR